MKGAARSRTQIHLSGRILKNNEKNRAKGTVGGMKEGVADSPSEFFVLWRNLFVPFLPAENWYRATVITQYR